MPKHKGSRNRPKAGTKAKRKGFKRTVMNLRVRRRDIDQIQVRARRENGGGAARWVVPAVLPPFLTGCRVRTPLRRTM